MSLIVDFTISVYSSSCNYLFFCLILPPFLSLYNYLHLQGVLGCKEIDKERKTERKRERGKKRELHELPYAEMKSTFWRISKGSTGYIRSGWNFPAKGRGECGALVANWPREKCRCQLSQQQHNVVRPRSCPIDVKHDSSPTKSRVKFATIL